MKYFEKHMLLCGYQITRIDQFNVEDVVNCQNSWDKGPPEGNSARG